jgi:predicted GNAT family acetyltransferase
VEREENRFVARVEGLRGREIAARLTEAAIAFARAEGLRVRPTCSYTRTFFHQHPELGQMLEDCA